MIGIDIGRVIISGDTDKPDQFFSNDYLNVREVPGAFESIQKIVLKYGAANVFLVSKCGEIVQQKSLSWLNHHNFFDKTGVAKNNVYFCVERHDKKTICEKTGIKVFIDDRYSVLKHLHQLDKLYLFNPSPEELALFKLVSDCTTEKIAVVTTWQAVLKDLSL